MPRLLLDIKIGERVHIGDATVALLVQKGNRSRLSIEAPEELIVRMVKVDGSHTGLGEAIPVVGRKSAVSNQPARDAGRRYEHGTHESTG